MRRLFPLVFLAAAGTTAFVAWTVVNVNNAIREACRLPNPSPRSVP